MPHFATTIVSDILSFKHNNEGQGHQIVTVDNIPTYCKAAEAQISELKAAIQHLPYAEFSEVNTLRTCFICDPEYRYASNLKKHYCTHKHCWNRRSYLKRAMFQMVHILKTKLLSVELALRKEALLRDSINKKIHVHKQKAASGVVYYDYRQRILPYLGFGKINDREAFKHLVKYYIRRYINSGTYSKPPIKFTLDIPTLSGHVEKLTINVNRGNKATIPDDFPFRNTLNPDGRVIAKIHEIMKARNQFTPEFSDLLKSLGKSRLSCPEYFRNIMNELELKEFFPEHTWIV